MMASVLLDDMTGRIEATLFNEAYEQYKDLLVVDQVLVMQGNLAHDEYRGGLSLRVDRVLSFEESRVQRVNALEIRLDESLLQERQWTPNKLVHDLSGLLRTHGDGSAVVSVRYRRQDAVGIVRLGSGWVVRPADDLLRQLYQQFGMDRVRIHYGPKQLVDPHAAQEQLKERDLMQEALICS